MNTHQLRSTLDRLLIALETAGWEFDRVKGTHGTRKLIFSRVAAAGDAAAPPAPG